MIIFALIAFIFFFIITILIGINMLIAVKEIDNNAKTEILAFIGCLILTFVTAANFIYTLYKDLGK